MNGKLRTKYRSSDELIDSIIYRPVEAFFSIQMDSRLLERVNENGDDMKDAILEIGEALVELGLCFVLFIIHVGEFLFFPVVMTVRFMKFRKDVIRREKEYRENLKRRFVAAEEK